MKNATSLANGNITMEWRGQQHAREAVESTASGATAATIAYIITMTDRMKKGMEELRPDWQIDQSIQSRAQFSNIKQELKAVSTATTSAKCYQVFTQVFPKPATV